MATTKTIEITKDWQQVASGDCVIQSLFYIGEFCLAVGGVPNDDNAYLLTAFNEPCTLEFGQPIFMKLPNSSNEISTTVTMIE